MRYLLILVPECLTDYIFTTIKPQKVFLLAVDGVAPRAKMNRKILLILEQRARRFRSAMEAKEKAEKAIKEGKELPKEPAFDSNCITPGILILIQEHHLWQSCKHS
jgi:5'-3' exoribonuclease 1